ncbi:hypothetical protein DFH09DRAFT_1330774 [Mycena vulgaris]|nr:hypothetical protein DFH09DRAFT_1330774 [Mycena vulgaris]
MSNTVFGKFYEHSSYPSLTRKWQIVGNVPYDVGEDALRDVLRPAGQIVDFKLMFNRDTGRGYGFCKFEDHATAASAVRNLDNTNVNGRLLCVRLADADPALGGKPTMNMMGLSQLNPVSKGSDILSVVPPGRPLNPGDTAENSITRALAEKMSESRLIEVLAHMKAFVITHPKQAHRLLSHNPQMAYAITMGLITSKVIPQSSAPSTSGKLPP